MNVEPQTHGCQDWQFPSPSSTPSSTTTEQAPFQTPKCEPSSHFLDAYYTPQVTGHQTPAATPVTQGFAIPQGRHSARTSPLIPQDPHFHVNHYNQEGHLALPPVDPSHRLTSSPDLSRTSDDLQKTLTLSAPEGLLRGSMDSFQMQTPPPTRDSSSRRDFERSQQGVAQTPGQMYPPAPSQIQHTPIRPAPPNLQRTPQFQTPTQFNQFQFSPGMFPYPAGGPASAPAMPQARFSWDAQSPSFSFANEAMMSFQQESFGPPHPISPGFAQWQAPQANPMPQQPQYESFELTNQHADFWTTPAMGGSTPLASFNNEQSSFISTSSSVNPNMVFSFTSLPQQNAPSPVRQSITPQKIDTTGRLPYEHQARESAREKEIAMKVRQTHSRVSSGSGRPPLQRSNTDTGARRPKMGIAESQRATQIIEQVERRASPLKRLGQMPLTAIPEVRARPKTRLVIGEDGRARTETVDTQGNALESQSGFSVWDDDSSEEEVVTNSRRNSFGMQPEQLQRRSSKHARTGSDFDRFDPSKRPVSSNSVSSLTSRLERTPIGKRSSREMNVDNRRFSTGNFSGLLGHDVVSPNKNDLMDGDDTDAQTALRKVMESRSKRQDTNNPQAVLNAHNQRWSQASIDMAKVNATQEHGRSYDPFASGNTSLSPASGTEPDILTPSTEHSSRSRSNDSTRCVCNTSESEGHIMVQCESCNKWLHIQCVGLDAQRLPPVYVCVFCTGTTPLARGGRIREPMRRGDPNRNSPLGYKSLHNLFRR